MNDPKQNVAEELVKTKVLAGSIGLFDINILPERYQKKRFRLVNVLPWFLFIILLAAVYPSWVMAREAQAILIKNQTEFSQVKHTFEIYQTNVNEFETLQTDIELAQQQRDQIISSYEGLQLQGSNWSETLSAIEEQIPDGILWTLIKVEENTIRLEGISKDYATILELEDTLKALEMITTVMIESIEQIIEDEPTVFLSDTGEDPQPATAQSSPFTFTINVIPREELP